jgi:hypothetical protein
MKKMIIATTLAFAATMSMANVTVSVGRDVRNDVNVVTAATTFKGVGLSATHANDTYTRVGVGKDFNLTKVGPVQLSAGGGAVYQHTRVAGAPNGYGLTASVTATVPLAKNVAVFATSQRFWGQDRVKAFDGTANVVGVSYSF